MSLLSALYERYRDRATVRKYQSLVDAIVRRQRHYRSRPHLELLTELLTARNRLKENVRSYPSRADEFLVEAYAVFSEAARFCFGYAPNTTQLFAAVLLWHGKVLEMKAGEGKTLTAALPSYLQALSGQGIHIITTNDYLAERDREWMGMVFERLGVSCGVITQDTEREARKREYAKDVTYVSNQEVGFDYLRDNLVMDPGERVLARFPFAIIDEIDSILIDEARTALIICQEAVPTKFESLPKLLTLIRQLTENEDYEVDWRFKTVDLTDAGTAKLVGLIGSDPFAAGDFETVQQIRLALYAAVFWKKDRDYLIRDNRIVFVDEFTGHPTPDRVLMDGMQQSVELGSGVEMSPERPITAMITYRGLFAKYGKVAGMSGTAGALADEWSHLYGLEVFEMSPHRKVRRFDLPTLFFRTEKEKFASILRAIEQVHVSAAPLLVVGRSVAQAKYFSTLLTERGMAHQLLTAEVTEKESDVVKNAGRHGMITVATNMAGRGTDIILDQEFKEKQGLVVYGLEPNLARRIDDQLRGRSGRQGQPGQTRFFASLEDEIFQVYADDPLWDYAEKVSWREDGNTNRKLEKFLLEAQNLAESLAAETRHITVQFDGALDHWREVLYKVRGRLLASPNIIQDIIQEVRHILFQELMPTMDYPGRFRLRSALIQNLKTEAVRYAPSGVALVMMGRILDAVFEERTRKDSEEEKFWRAASYSIAERMRSKILELVDTQWQQYLATAHWLEDEISLETASGDDPLVEFMIRSKDIFRDMRREFALKTLRLLFVELMDSSSAPEQKA